MCDNYLGHLQDDAIKFVPNPDAHLGYDMDIVPLPIIDRDKERDERDKELSEQKQKELEKQAEIDAMQDNAGDIIEVDTTAS